MAGPSRRDVWIAFLAILALVLMVWIATCNPRPNTDAWDGPLASLNVTTPPGPS